MSDLLFSEALRLGIPMFGEIRNGFVRPDRNGNMCGCAIGTAALAAGYNYATSVSRAQDWAVERWPYLRHAVAPEMSLLRKISGEHFFLDKSRTELADLAESYERAWGLWDGREQQNAEGDDAAQAPEQDMPAKAAVASW